MFLFQQYFLGGRKVVCVCSTYAELRYKDIPADMGKHTHYEVIII